MAQQRVSQGGLSTYTDELGNATHVKTFTCCHCNQVFDVPKANEPEVGFCTRCFARECIRCARKGVCVPFMKKIESHERRSRLLIAASEG
ncbi:MAG: hypothetical protein EPN98_21380 [Phenylobacterium sp.]|uniref:hypothetical protein n=1 Tax=Phenylobacterium sp. TaxID=1871053 RepID=UPI0011FF2685|nr:hypothetical protein [Phenylobacterium sp.]TAL28997.1 MAG: hypothetical protein EPN98_21380 [Phenylobacterium sp.]